MPTAGSSSPDSGESLNESEPDVERHRQSVQDLRSASIPPRPGATPSTSPGWVQELRRLRSLYTLDLIGTGELHRFDRFSRIASTVLDMPVALVTVLDDDHQWFCAATGTDLDGNVRAESFCTHLVDDPSSLLIVEDTHDDDRFVNLPVVAGPPHVRFYAGASISTPDGECIGSLCVLDVRPRRFDEQKQQVLRDLADLVESEIGHLRLALVDELTQLANRRAFMSAGERYLALAARRGDPVSLVYCDIDGLKTVNDTYGHIAGDGMIVRASGVLGTTVRTIDFVARIGGDEFAIVLYGVDQAEAEQTVRRLERAAEMSNTDAHLPPLTMSFGIATSEPGTGLVDLLERADEAMYERRRSAGV